MADNRLATMVSGPSTSKSRFKEMCMRLELPEGEYVLLMYAGVQTMSDLYFKNPTTEALEKFMEEEPESNIGIVKIAGEEGYYTDDFDYKPDFGPGFGKKEDSKVLFN